MSKIILMGDSITDYLRYFSTKLLLKPKIGFEDDEVKYYGIENIGIGTYKNYIWPHVERDEVDFYLLLLGINNILRPDCDYDEEQSLADVNKKLESLIKVILEETSAKLIVQSLYPTNILSGNVNSKVVYVNERLHKFCDDNKIDYLDMYSLLVDDNQALKVGYSDDEIHPNKLGYSVIAQAINEKIKTLKNRKI